MTPKNIEKAIDKLDSQKRRGFIDKLQYRDEMEKLLAAAQDRDALKGDAGEMVDELEDRLVDIYDELYDS